MYKKIFAGIAVSFLFFMQNSFADMYSLNTGYSQQSNIIYIPAGATVNAVLLQDINSNTAIVGQTVSAVLTDDFMYNNKLISSSGSVILGSIVFNRKAGIAGRTAQMQIRFTAIRTPYNNIIPISAVVATKDNTGILKGENSYSDLGVTGAGGLAVAQTVATKGNNIFIPTNTALKIAFEQPITLSAQ